ncbi:hypothetical protein FQA39_LY02081 [Lamprigera yunnana]|nr:hypothetical protein FQA39_LY02081 [Lamprigera yunnana]
MFHINFQLRNVKLLLTHLNLRRAWLTNASANPFKSTEDTRVESESPNDSSKSIPEFASLRNRISVPYDQNTTETILGIDEKNLTAVEDIVPIPTLDALRNSLPFDSMPGPQSIRLLAKLWSIVPLQGKQVEFVQNIAGADRLFSYLNWYDNQTLFKRMIREYGPIVRLQGPFGGNVIVMLRLEDAMNLTKNEGQFPIRSSIDSLEQYRLECRRYKQAGPFLT